ncbi:MAG: ABC transporter permease, partial [Blastocatellia bacterium]
MAPLKLWQIRVLASRAAAAGLFTAIVAGTMPALIVTRPLRAATLQAGGRQSYSSRHTKLGKMLIPIQVALSLVLVAVAGLFVASLARLLTTSTGMRADGVFMAGTSLERRPEKGDQLDALYARMLDHLATRPGVQSASVVQHEPMTDDRGYSHFISRDASSGAHEDKFQGMNSVGPRFFETMGIPLLSGRDFVATDNAHSPGVCILSVSSARFFFPDGQAIGSHIEA